LLFKRNINDVFLLDSIVILSAGLHIIDDGLKSEVICLNINNWTWSFIKTSLKKLVL